jgi:hypothetical protein
LPDRRTERFAAGLPKSFAHECGRGIAPLLFGMNAFCFQPRQRKWREQECHAVIALLPGDEVRAAFFAWQGGDVRPFLDVAFPAQFFGKSFCLFETAFVIGQRSGNILALKNDFRFRS